MRQRKENYSVRDYNKLVKKQYKLTRKEFLIAYAEDICNKRQIEIPSRVTKSGNPVQL